MLSIAWMMFRLMKLEFHHAHHRRSAAQKASPTVGSTPLPASLPPSSSSLPRPAQRCGARPVSSAEIWACYLDVCRALY